MSEAANVYSYLSNQAKFKLNENSKIEDYFNSEIQEGKIMNKELSKYIAPFDYFDKALIVFSAATGRISIISFASIIEAFAEIANASFSLIFFYCRNNKKIIKNKKKNRKKNHNKIVM